MIKVYHVFASKHAYTRIDFWEKYTNIFHVLPRDLFVSLHVAILLGKFWAELTDCASCGWEYNRAFLGKFQKATHILERDRSSIVLLLLRSTTIFLQKLGAK